MQFNDITNFKGIIQMYEKECGMSPGDISGNITRLKQVTADINLAVDDYFALALPASGTWMLDDTNQVDQAVIRGNLIAGQKDYSFTTDQTGNLILDIYKVFIADASGNFTELTPRDPRNENVTDDTNIQPFINGATTQGVPSQYSKSGNTITFDVFPSYSKTLGIKIMFNREGTYFVYTDTTKKPGVPGAHHKYFALKPAMDYVRRNNSALYAGVAAEVMKYEGDVEHGVVGSIQRFFGKRDRDTRGRLVPYQSSTK